MLAGRRFTIPQPKIRNLKPKTRKPRPETTDPLRVNGEGIAAVERIRHVYDSHGHILAFAFR